MRYFSSYMVLFAAILTGCTGSLQSSFVSTNMATIMVQPTDARTVQLNCAECYWWVDQDNHLNIAGKGIQKSLIHPRYDQEFYISFVLDEPSKGVGKNYQLNANTTRGFLKSGGNLFRFRGTYGIMGIENQKSSRLAGAYRTHISLNMSQIFGGWSSPVPFLVFGTLTAVPDARNKGKTFLKKTEEEGYERRKMTKS
jgi:hypothetical protein